MAMPKPILVTILIMAAVAVVFAVVIFRMIPATTPDQQAVPGKLEAPANQGGVGKIGARIPAGASGCVCH